MKRTVIRLAVILAATLVLIAPHLASAGDLNTPLQWNEATTREDGSALLPSEIARYEIEKTNWNGDFSLLSTRSLTLVDVVAVPSDGVERVVHYCIYTVDTGNLRSNTCTPLDVTVKLDKKNPSPPTGFTLGN